MRISDWSSDVCSSDLTPHAASTCLVWSTHKAHVQKFPGRHHRLFFIDVDGVALSHDHDRIAGKEASCGPPTSHACRTSKNEMKQSLQSIGRESCRVRVGSYI